MTDRVSTAVTIACSPERIYDMVSNLPRSGSAQDANADRWITSAATTGVGWQKRRSHRSIFKIGRRG